MPEIFKITPAELTPNILAEWIYPDLAHDLYWSDLWDPAFYVALARAGFISICAEFEGSCLLLPQLQRAYAVLDWPERRENSGIRRLLRSEQFQRENVRLQLTHRTSAVIAGIQDAYGAGCWLHPPYCDLLHRLEEQRSGRLRLYAVELRSAGGYLIGGELGYTIGATYTSLTGFLNRDRRWNNCGKLQLHMLGALLASCGYAFWNLGQPRMQYKLDLGARVRPRAEFLKRWWPASTQTPARNLEDLVNVPFFCAGAGSLKIF